MKTLLYIIALLFFISWIIGFLQYNAGWPIHILLAIAVVSILVNLIDRGEPGMRK